FQFALVLVPHPKRVFVFALTMGNHELHPARQTGLQCQPDTHPDRWVQIPGAPCTSKTDLTLDASWQRNWPLTPAIPMSAFSPFPAAAFLSRLKLPELSTLRSTSGWSANSALPASLNSPWEP